MLDSSQEILSSRVLVSNWKPEKVRGLKAEALCLKAYESEQITLFVPV